MGPVRELVLLLLLPLGACGPGTPPPREDPVVLQPLLDRLDRLVAALQASATAPSPTMAPAVPGVEPAANNERHAVEPSAELLQRIEALEREVARLQESTGSHRLEPMGEAPRPKMAHVVEVLSSQLNGTNESEMSEARRSLFCLSEQQVLQRLGMPDQTEVSLSHQGEIYWFYHGGEKSFTLHFVNGHVAAFK
jgi:hypothetical protein